MPLAFFVASAALTAYGAIKKNQAAKQAAAVDSAVADYNARTDEATSAQIDLDTQENIRTQREDNAVYLSRQASSYAAAGVLSNTGSALDAQIKNVGRMEQGIQQRWVDLNAQQQKLAASARIGRLEGAARSDSDKAEGTLALINGGAQIARSAYGAYDSGVFSGGKG